jgi:endonuclease YncB( thermonuclease family)
LIPPSSILSRVGVSALIVVASLCTAPLDLVARGGSKDWIVLKHCRLIANPANDGDSFHVSAGDKEYLFRFYFVDAPETDAMIPGRLVEQGKYFGITVPQAIEVGQAAKEFVRERLSAPFTVFTHLSGAMGQSRLERFYALVQTKDGDLGEQLVRNGLARPYGFKAAPPGLQSSRIEVDKLQQLEDEAKREKIGAWGMNPGRMSVPAETSSALNSFVADGTTPSRSSPTDLAAVVSPVTKPAVSIPRSSPVEAKKSHTKEKTQLRKIDINTATEKELTTVPGIGHVMAAASLQRDRSEALMI